MAGQGATNELREVPSGAFFGTERLAELCSALVDASDGHGATLLVSAEPGAEGAALVFGSVGSVLGLLGSTAKWREVAAFPPKPLVAESTPDQFRKEGDFWTIAYAGRVIRLKDTKGLAYIAELLRNPGQDVHAVDLVASTERTGRAAAREVPLGSAGAILDAKAKSEYRRRLAELREELAAAEARHDLGSSSRAQAEIGFLESELAGAIGLCGRDREAASNAERGRWVATKRIKEALAKIREAHPRLWKELAPRIKTGQLCSYRPDPDRQIDWLL